MILDGKSTKYLVLILTLFMQKIIAACPENCNSCDEQDICISCKTGYWDLDKRCQLTCGAECLNKDCKTDNGNCIACNPGFYGNQCQRDCSLCEGEFCGSRSCTYGCKAGYYEYQDTVDSLCFSCSQSCRSCSNTSVCNVCNSGFYLFKYRANGKVHVVCDSCYDRPDCTNFCAIQNCDQCQIQDDLGLLCTQCIDGYRYNGQICIPHEITCTQSCSTDCDENGICKGSCKAGWTGERCSDPCASQCLKCDKNNTDICEECNGDYYTVTCDVICDQSCIKVADKRTCRQNDGFCYNGCENSLWGQNCNQSCSEGCADNGVTQVCDRDSGRCTNGCVVGYTGDTCKTTISKSSTMESAADSSTIGTKMQTNSHAAATTEIPTCIQYHENTDTKTIFVTGYMSGVGTAIFVVIITAALYHLRQRYIVKKSKSYKEDNATDETTTYYNENAAETREPGVQLVGDANNYESLASNRNTEKVYSELESQAQQQGHSYYNLDAMI